MVYIIKFLNIYLILFNYITLHAKDGNIISAFFQKNCNYFCCNDSPYYSFIAVIINILVNLSMHIKEPRPIK